MRLLILLLLINVAYGNYVELDSKTVLNDRLDILDVSAMQGEIIQARHLNKKFEALWESIQPEQVMYLNVINTTAYSTTVTQSTSFIPYTYTSLSGDIFGSLNGTDISLDSGKYIIEVPQCSMNAAGWLYTKINDITAPLESQEFRNIAVNHEAALNLRSCQEVNFNLEINSPHTIRIEFKSASGGGAHYTSRVRILRIGD